MLLWRNFWLTLYATFADSVSSTPPVYSCSVCCVSEQHMCHSVACWWGYRVTPITFTALRWTHTSTCSWRNLHFDYIVYGVLTLTNSCASRCFILASKPHFTHIFVAFYFIITRSEIAFKLAIKRHTPGSRIARGIQFFILLGSINE